LEELDMPRYMSAKEFRQKFAEIGEDLKAVKEIVVVKRSKPLFKVVPFEELPSDLLERASLVKDSRQPELQEIARIVHQLRRSE
jgi:antitoxin (DNA-binding transcriptional repressor) of toxin-antitoxin stability system